MDAGDLKLILSGYLCDLVSVFVPDVSGEAMVISQFTLQASTKKGNRPSYMKAAHPQISEPLYENFILTLSELISKPCATGKFGADMQVTLTNDGPVTIIIDTKNKE